MDIRTGFGKADFMGLVGRYKKLHSLRKLPVYHLNKQVAQNGVFGGLFNPKEIFPRARLGCDVLALIEYQGKKAFYMCSFKRAWEIWGRRQR